MASENSLISYENCCRTCMNEDTTMFDIFIKNFYSTNLADVLTSCTRLNVQEEDALPKKICKFCQNCLLNFYNFRELAEKVDAKLRELAFNNNEPNTFMNVEIEKDLKVDIKEENEFDGNYLMLEPKIEMKQEDISVLDTDSKKLPDECCTSSSKSKCRDKSNKKKYICHHCNKSFLKLPRLQYHLQRHTFNEDNDEDNKKSEQQDPILVNNKNIITNGESTDKSLEHAIQCSMCPSKFKSVNSLSAHMRKHTNKGRIIACSKCGKVFKKTSHLQRHEKTHDNSHQYKCTLCPRSFQCEETLKGHVNGHNGMKPHKKSEQQEPKLVNNENIITNGESTDKSLEHAIQCSMCPSKFKSVNSLSAHMRKHTEKGRIIACSKCGKVFKKISHLKRHEKTHDNSRQYKCTLCPRSFQSEETLKGHVNRHNGIKPHSCPLCPKSFAHLTTLTAHIKVHQRDKFLCPTCGKKFDSSTNLDQHMRRHLGLKQFACTMCPRRFVSKGELKSHTITHTGEKSYTCDQCGASFTKRTSLVKHKLRHLGIKPYQCETCSMKFSSRDHLKRHNRIHTGEKPYKCEMCERAFTQSNDLVKHRRAHLGDKIYKCTECSESFRLHIELRQHISDHFISSQLQELNVANKERRNNDVKITDDVEAQINNSNIIEK